MKKLLNTLYVMSEDAYLSLEGEAVEVSTANNTKTIPLHTLEAIVSFSYKGASPALMGKCAEMNVGLSFFTPRGKYLASVRHNENGNVLLRREQYRLADNDEKSIAIAKNFLTGKLYNSKFVLLRSARDHALRVNEQKIRDAASEITHYLYQLREAENDDILRGIEGKAATEYFGAFDEMILQNKRYFKFTDRNRRPPTDPVNAMLSFAYSVLMNDCAAALQSVGIDPYVGFFHTDRPGRKSLALDLMEEFRAPVADRFVLTMINKKLIAEEDFEQSEDGAIFLKEKGRKTFFTQWQERKKEEIIHPFLKEKIHWGLVPYVQALLLSRYIRGDLDEYPPFLWK